MHVDEITHAYSTEEKAYKSEEENVVVESISYQDNYYFSIVNITFVWRTTSTRSLLDWISMKRKSISESGLSRPWLLVISLSYILVWKSEISELFWSFFIIPKISI
jgi:hypothetical protein